MLEAFHFLEFVESELRVSQGFSINYFAILRRGACLCSYTVQPEDVLSNCILEKINIHFAFVSGYNVLIIIVI